jgi:hypothetical protein
MEQAVVTNNTFGTCIKEGAVCTDATNARIRRRAVTMSLKASEKRK